MDFSQEIEEKLEGLNEPKMKYPQNVRIETFEVGKIPMRDFPTPVKKLWQFLVRYRKIRKSHIKNNGVAINLTYRILWGRTEILKTQMLPKKKGMGTRQIKLRADHK